MVRTGGLEEIDRKEKYIKGLQVWGSGPQAAVRAQMHEMGVPFTVWSIAEARAGWFLQRIR